VTDLYSAKSSLAYSLGHFLLGFFWGGGRLGRIFLVDLLDIADVNRLL
jgi:hypothetical protein